MGVLAASVVMASAVSGCRGDTSAPREGPSGPAEQGAPGLGTTLAAQAVPDPQPAPRSRLVEAVEALLEAERRGDTAASFLLLSRQSRAEYKDVADWTMRRQQLPRVIAFRIDPASQGERGEMESKVVAVVEHVPGLDPFKGLSLAQERQVFIGRRDGAGWLVDGDPETEPILPAEALAVEAATAWVAAVQACDKDRADKLQAVPTIFGSAEGAVGLCGTTGPVGTEGVVRLAPGVASTDIVAQYSSDALAWARVVRITTPAPFGVVLAPLGDRWKVLGLTD